MLFLIVLCLLATGFFSGIEMAFITLNKFKLRHLIETRNKRAIIIGNLLKNPEKILSTTLVGTNIFIVTGAILADNYVIQYFPRNGVVLSSIGMTFLVLLFGEIVPKSVFRQYAEKIVLRSAYPLRLINYIFYPVTEGILSISNIMLRMFTKEKIPEKKPFITKEELKFIAKHSIAKEHQDIDRERMIDRALSFSKITVQEVMVPLDKTVMIDIDSSVQDVLDLTRKQYYSRVPVYEKRKEKVKGLVNVYDIIFDEEKKEDLRDYLRQPYYLYKNEKIDRVLYLLKDNRRPLAMVIDNEKECQGIITLEDIIRKIVGQIEA